jgi:hypothetical protein
MHLPNLRLVVPATVTILFLATGQAAANYYELLRRVPESCNTIILIDVERMLMSPVAMREKWRDKGNSEGVALHFPINAVRYMLASKIDFIVNLADQGDVALIETAEGVSVPYLARTEGGYLDTVDGQEIAYSPRDAFFVSFKPNILGVSFPANRQELARWLRAVKRLDQPQVSEYLQQAVKLAHGKDHMVVAMDLADLFTPRMVRDRLRTAESLAGKNVDMDAITRVLTSAKGVTLTMAATDRLDAKVRLDLGESSAPIKNIAKGLMLEVLEKYEMLLPEMRDWRLLLEANAVSLEGRLTSMGLRKLTELIPFPTDTVELKRPEGAPTENAAGPAPASSPDAKVAASKKYFQRISQRLDDLRVEVKGAAKPKFAQKMLNDAALEIDRLPVLNVDDELLAYGAGVSSSLRNMRNLSKNASLDYEYRKAGIQGSAGYGYGYGGFYGGGSVAGATTTTYRQESAVLESNELAVLTMLEEKTAEIRKKMTLKYQVEF